MLLQHSFKYYRKLDIIYSLDTRPIINGRWGCEDVLRDTLNMFCLSILDTHSLYENVYLYTDELGYKMLCHLPIKIILLQIETSDVFWMRSKIFAMTNHPRPFIHMDGDVFIKNKFTEGNWDIIAERKECSSYNIHYKKQVDWLQSKSLNLLNWTYDINYSINCGIVGFSDLNIRDQFINQYNQWEKTFIEVDEIMNKQDPFYEPCIVVEQYNLTCLIEKFKYNIHYNLQGCSDEEIQISAVTNQYIHLYGKSKYEDFYKNKIIERLIEKYKYFYNKLINKFEAHDC